MIADTLHAYFQSLVEVSRAIEITDGVGVALSVEEGARRAVDVVANVGSGKVMLIGNGGSSAIASHVHNDLCKSVGVRAMVFTETPLLTATSNDESYSVAFERGVALWADPADVLVAISSSGNSQNIIRAVRAATERRCRTITLSGFNPANRLRGMGEVNFYVPSDVYGYVESTHMALAHFLTDACVRTKRLALA